MCKPRQHVKLLKPVTASSACSLYTRTVRGEEAQPPREAGSVPRRAHVGGRRRWQAPALIGRDGGRRMEAAEAGLL